MQEENESAYSKLEPTFELKYEQEEAEGECILLGVWSVRFIKWRFVLYILLNVLLLIPLLLTYWYLPHNLGMTNTNAFSTCNSAGFRRPRTFTSSTMTTELGSFLN